MLSSGNPLQHAENDEHSSKRNTMEFEVVFVGNGGDKQKDDNRVVSPAARANSNGRRPSPRPQSNSRVQPSPNRNNSSQHRDRTPTGGYAIASERPVGSSSSSRPLQLLGGEAEEPELQRARPSSAPEVGEPSQGITSRQAFSRSGILIDDGSSQRLPAPAARTSAPMRTVSPPVAANMAATSSSIPNGSGIIIDDSSVGKPRAMSARNHRSPAMILNNMPTSVASEGPHSARQAPTVPSHYKLAAKNGGRSSSADLGLLVHQNATSESMPKDNDNQGEDHHQFQPDIGNNFKSNSASQAVEVVTNNKGGTDRRRSPSTILRESVADLQAIKNPEPESKAASRPLDHAHVNNNPFTNNNNPSSSRHPAHEPQQASGQAGAASALMNVHVASGEGMQAVGGAQLPDNNNGSDDMQNPNKGAVQHDGGMQQPGGSQHNTRITIGMMIRKWVVLSRIGAGSFGETFCAAEMPEGFNIDEYHRLVEQVRRQYTNGAASTYPGLTNTTNTGSIGSRGAAEEDDDDNSSRKRSGGGVGASHGIHAQNDGVHRNGFEAAFKLGHDGLSTNEDETTEAKSSATARRICLDVLALLPPHMKPIREVCIKVEQDCKNVLRLEVQSIRKCQECPQVVRIINSGHIDQPLSVNYLVMERLGPNLADLRRACPNNTFDVYTSLRVGISCLKVIRSIHELGLTHRDIKPSNFVVGLGPVRSKICYLIDFGLARRFRRSNGQIRPARENTGFRGTNRYASIQSHKHCELGRVDDLWSLLFMLVEMVTGALPWRKYKDKEQIGECKMATVNETLVQEMPREFTAFLQHLQSLTYESDPNYDFLIQLLEAAIVRRNYHEDRPLGWERSAAHMLELDATDDGRTTRPIPLPMVIKPVTTLQMSSNAARRPPSTTLPATNAPQPSGPHGSEQVNPHVEGPTLAQIASPDSQKKGGSKSFVSGSLYPVAAQDDEDDLIPGEEEGPPLVLSSAPLLGDSESVQAMKAMRASTSVSNVPAAATTRPVTVGGTIASPIDPKASSASPPQHLPEPAPPFEIEDDIEEDNRDDEAFAKASSSSKKGLVGEQSNKPSESMSSKPTIFHVQSHSVGSANVGDNAGADTVSVNPFNRLQQVPLIAVKGGATETDASLGANGRHNDSGGSGNGARDYSSPEHAAKDDEVLSNTQIEHNPTHVGSHHLPPLTVGNSNTNGANEATGGATNQKSPRPNDSGSSGVEVFAPPQQSSPDELSAQNTHLEVTTKPAAPNQSSHDATNNNKPTRERKGRRERSASTDRVKCCGTRDCAIM